MSENCREYAPELHDAVTMFGTRRTLLDAKTHELLALAVHASACTLHDPGINRHVELALGAGADPADIIDVLATIAPLGNHTIVESLPVVLEELERLGENVSVPELTEGAAAAKARFLELRGYWTDGRERTARYLPGFFADYMALSEAPWRFGTLDPKTREFLCIAIDSSVAHGYQPGVRVHVRKAIEYGATRDELLAVLEVVATLGVPGFERGMRALARALADGGTE